MLCGCDRGKIFTCIDPPIDFLGLSQTFMCPVLLKTNQVIHRLTQELQCAVV